MDSDEFYNSPDEYDDFDYDQEIDYGGDSSDEEEFDETSDLIMEEEQPIQIEERPEYKQGFADTQRTGYVGFDSKTPEGKAELRFRKIGPKNENILEINEKDFNKCMTCIKARGDISHVHEILALASTYYLLERKGKEEIELYIKRMSRTILKHVDFNLSKYKLDFIRYLIYYSSSC